MFNIMQRPLSERYDHLLAVVSNPRFLKMQGLGNEVPFFICPFPPEEAVAIGKIGNQLINKLETLGVRVLKINLYDLAVDLLKQRNLWERLLAEENQYSKDELKELLQGVLDPESHLIPAIAERMRQKGAYDVMFLSGVGEVFPYIRSHTILNNLQAVAKYHPTVMFFPGEYVQSLERGASLELFGKLHDDKYYRAFNIYHTHV